MNRAASHTQSAPQLPHAKLSPPPHRDGARALANLISAALLPPRDEPKQEELVELDDKARFRITDLLPEQTAHQQTRVPRKRANPGRETTQARTKETPSHVSLSPIQNVTKAGPIQNYVRSLERPENTELFTYASALCHRITGRYISKELLRSDPNAQKNEITRIQSDPELLQAISTIKTLSKEFKDVAHAALGHRKELGYTLLRIEESYLKLFEKLMELSLRMYWKYEQDNDAERRADKATIKYWQEMHNWKAGEATKLQKLLEGKEILLRTRQVELQDWEKQCAELQREVGDQRALQAQIFELQADERDLREHERVLQADFNGLKIKHGDMLLYERSRLEEAHEQHKRMMDDMRLTLREKDEQLTHHEKAIRNLTVLTTPVVTATATSQTEVDDDGLWDTRDGMPKFVSKDLQHRMAWRRFHAYATCKNCRGRPVQQARGILAREPGSIETDNDYVDVWSLTRGERKSKKAVKRIERIETEWRLPQSMLSFLSNLPKTVVAFPFYSVEQVIQQIELIYDDKFESDKADEADGVAREELPNFMCEYFLKTHGLRQSAEVGLYRFLLSVKSTYLRNSHIHLFARFCGLLSNEACPSPLKDIPVGAGTLMAALVEKPRRTQLDRSFLSVYLQARYIVLRTPPPKISKKGTLQPQPTPHVVQTDPCKKWIPLDHAVVVTRWYLNFLPDDAPISYCREVEYSTAIYAGGTVTEIAGNRLAVRAEMRKAMLVNGETGELDESQITEKELRRKPRIVADVHKVLLLLMHALEERREVMEKALVTMFEAGDVNHDCVLSFEEFKAIIRVRAKSFSDLRLLRMFREALMGGTDQSFALSMEAFVKVCNDHGLVTLLPDDRWSDPFEKAFEAAAKTAVTSTAANKLSAALKALTKQKRETPVPAASTVDPETEIPEDLPEGNKLEAPLTLLTSSRADEIEEDEGLWEW